MPVETVIIDALDGARLQADLVRVDGNRGSVVLTHPHPLYGGDRFNPVVDALFAALPAAGFTALRFDFRGVNASTGEHDDGDAERLDLVAAIELLEFVQPDASVWLVGYSFGAAVALNVVDPRVAGWVAVAPPLRSGTRYLADGDHRPKHLLVPEHDQYSPPEHTRSVTADWRSASIETLASADHFLGGQLATVTDLVTAALTSA